MTSVSINDDEEQICFAGRLTADCRRAVPLAGTSRKPVHEDFELERLARDDLTPKTGPLDPAEEGQLAGVPVVEQHGDATELGQRFDHEHAGQRGAPREMAAEKRLV